jgi:transposase
MENVQISPTLNQYLNTTDYSATQLILPLDCAVLIEENDPIRSFCELLEGVNLKAFVKKYTKGRHDYEDLTLIRILLFAYMNQITSLRDIEAACRNDIRFIWLGQGIRPSHMTFQRLIRERLAGRFEELFLEINRHLIAQEAIKTDILYIDGTKFEANATKNSFVWKKAVLRYQDKLYLKITNFYASLGLETQATYSSEDLLPLKTALLKDCLNHKIVFVSGIGKPRTTLQKHYDTVKNYHEKLSLYEKHLGICQKRNSYSKSDHDATFMHMKEDYYMRTGIFKAGYNVQLGVSDEYVLMAKTYPNPTDTLTFIPFMESFKKAYGFYPKTPVADAGYGSYDNYLYCLTHDLELVQKYNYYEAEKRTKQDKLIYQAKSMRQADGSFRCPLGKAFVFESFELKQQGPYPKLLHRLKCEDCTNCPVASDCKKGQGNRQLEINPVLFELQDIAKSNLDSPRGIQLRVNRSIQSESTFGILKHNWGKQRFTRRGKENVENELYLLIIGFNLMKYHQKKRRKKLS